MAEFIAPTNFKSYDELKKRMFEVLGGDIRGGAPENQNTAEDLEESDFGSKAPAIKQKPRAEEVADDEMDVLKYFEEFKKG